MKTLAYTQTIKQKLCYGVSNHQMWFEVTQDEIIAHDKYLKPHSDLNWFKIN